MPKGILFILVKNKNDDMNTIKKLAGYVWMLMAPLLILFLLYQANEKISHAAAAVKSNVILQWVIILLVFIFSALTHPKESMITCRPLLKKYNSSIACAQIHII